MVAGIRRLNPELTGVNQAPGCILWIDRMEAGAGVRVAVVMPKKVPETLRTFGG